jgi:hypothetical protein
MNPIENDASALENPAVVALVSMYSEVTAKALFDFMLDFASITSNKHRPKFTDENLLLFVSWVAQLSALHLRNALHRSCMASDDTWSPKDALDELMTLACQAFQHAACGPIEEVSQ